MAAFERLGGAACGVLGRAPPRRGRGAGPPTCSGAALRGPLAGRHRGGALGGEPRLPVPAHPGADERSSGGGLVVARPGAALRRARVVGAARGAAAALAILTRPNLAPVAMVPLAAGRSRARWSRVAPPAREDARPAPPRPDRVRRAESPPPAWRSQPSTRCTIGSPLASGYDVRGLFVTRACASQPGPLSRPAHRDGDAGGVARRRSRRGSCGGALRRRRARTATVPSGRLARGRGALVVAVFACDLFDPGSTPTHTLRFLVPGTARAVRAARRHARAAHALGCPPPWRALVLVALVG